MDAVASGAWCERGRTPSEIKREELQKRDLCLGQVERKSVAADYLGCMRIAPSTLIVSPFTITLP